MTEHKIIERLPEHPVPAAAHDGSLHVCGLVTRAISLTPAEVAAMPEAVVAEDFVCDEGWTVPRQQWRGVLVGDLLDAAGVETAGEWVEFAAGDFCFSQPIEDARAALVALSLNNEALTEAHGGPFRLYVPGEACYTSIKWLDRIEVRASAGINHAERIATHRLTEARSNEDAQSPK